MEDEWNYKNSLPQIICSFYSQVFLLSPLKRDKLQDMYSTVLRYIVYILIPFVSNGVFPKHKCTNVVKVILDAGFLHKSDDLMVKLCLYLCGVKVHVVSEASEDTVALVETVVDFIHRMIYSISDPQNSACEFRF